MAKKKLTKQNGWELNSGLFEIYWKNDVADRVRIAGATFYYISHKNKPARVIKQMEGKP